MTTTHRMTTVATSAAALLLALVLAPPTAQATRTDGCVAVGRTTDIAEVVAFRKQQAARYYVDHLTELAANR